MKRNNNFSYKIVVRGNSEEERDIFFVDTLEEGATTLNTTFFSKFPIISRSMLSRSVDRKKKVKKSCQPQRCYTLFYMNLKYIN